MLDELVRESLNVMKENSKKGDINQFIHRIVCNSIGFLNITFMLYYFPLQAGNNTMFSLFLGLLSSGVICADT